MRQIAIDEFNPLHSSSFEESRNQPLRSVVLLLEVLFVVSRAAKPFDLSFRADDSLEFSFGNLTIVPYLAWHSRYDILVLTLTILSVL